MRNFYPVFFFATSLVVWFAHGKLFEAGGTGFKRYIYKMKYKYFKTLHRIAFAGERVKTYSQNEVMENKKVGVAL